MSVKKECGLLTYNPVYKPFQYPWAYEAWKAHEQMHWLADETPLADDVKDWQKSLTPTEKNLLTQIFRFFTQADVEVSNCYNRFYLNIFKPTEVLMMLSGFSNRESTHIAAYSYLLDTVGMPELEYSAFMQYKEMKDKFDYFQNFTVDSPYEIAKTMAAFGAFTEGLQLFASFAILLNFPRFNKMKGMGQIVTWSVRDETVHCQNIIKLFHTFLDENKGLWSKQLKDELRDICTTVVSHEDAFVDLAFSMGDVNGLTAQDIKQYIRYIADRRCIELRMKPIFKVKDNPLPWLDEQLNAVEHANFFEARSTEYSRSATRGLWDEAFD